MHALTGEQFSFEKWHELLDVFGTVLITIGAVAVGYGVWRMGQPIFPLAQTHVAATTSALQDASLNLPPSEPIRIDIAPIGVHSAMAYVGLNADGSPGVPSGRYIDLPSWLTTSATPGETGTAIIIGHVDSVKSGPSIFYNLGKIMPGNTVAILRQDGKTAVFTVDAVRVFDKKAFPSSLVYGRTTFAALRLITCTGRWDPWAGKYTQNLVIFASLTSVR